MGLYLVEVTFSLPVEAESATAAEHDAIEDWAADELNTNGLPSDCEAHAWPIAETSKRWGNCLPWGGDGERTIAQILNAPPTPEKLETPHAK